MAFFSILNICKIRQAFFTARSVKILFNITEELKDIINKDLTTTLKILFHCQTCKILGILFVYSTRMHLMKHKEITTT